MKKCTLVLAIFLYSCVGTFKETTAPTPVAPSNSVEIVSCSASIEDNGILLTWTEPENWSRLSIYRKISTQEIENEVKLETFDNSDKKASYLDPSADKNVNHQYSLRFDDSENLPIATAKCTTSK